LIMGSNMAENHPVGFRWPMKAKERGATLIHVDPRFTRTSASADLYVPIRSGSDIAFLGGLINYVLTHDKWFKEYVLAYTNASSIVSDDYVDAEDNDGLFSGYDAQSGSYDNASWAYSGKRAETLQDPRCVFQILKRPYAVTPRSRDRRTCRRCSTCCPATCPTPRPSRAMRRSRNTRASRPSEAAIGRTCRNSSFRC